MPARPHTPLGQSLFDVLASYDLLRHGPPCPGRLQDRSLRIWRTSHRCGLRVTITHTPEEGVQPRPGLKRAITPPHNQTVTPANNVVSILQSGIPPPLEFLVTPNRSFLSPVGYVTRYFNTTLSPSVSRLPADGICAVTTSLPFHSTRKPSSCNRTTADRADNPTRSGKGIVRNFCPIDVAIWSAAPAAKMTEDWEFSLTSRPCHLRGRAPNTSNPGSISTPGVARAA